MMAEQAPSPLQSELTENMKTAMRSGDKKRLAIIRLILAEIQQKEVDTRQALDDKVIMKLLNKMLKQRRESMEQYKKAERHDLFDQENYELGVISEYLPESLSEEEIEKIVIDAIETTSASSMKDMGKIMSYIKSNVKDNIDMAVVSTLVKNKLL
ncbi:MAG: GatB/YqeY domain-containing protein [Pseudomonadota bacterium]